MRPMLGLARRVIVVVRAPDVDKGERQRGETAYHQPCDNAGAQIVEQDTQHQTHTDDHTTGGSGTGTKKMS